MSKSHFVPTTLLTKSISIIPIHRYKTQFINLSEATRAGLASRPPKGGALLVSSVASTPNRITISSAHNVRASEHDAMPSAFWNIPNRSTLGQRLHINTHSTVKRRRLEFNWKAIPTTKHHPLVIRRTGALYYYVQCVACRAAPVKSHDKPSNSLGRPPEYRPRRLGMYRRSIAYLYR